MSVAYYIVLDNEDPGFETFVNGKAIAHAMEALDALCEQEGLPKLESFFGQSLEELAELLDEEIDIPEDEDPGPQWFEPAEGLALVDALIATLQKQPGVLNAAEFPKAEDVLEDLTEYKSVLTAAEKIGAKWHLSLDL